MGYKSFEDLEVYKAAREYRKKIYKLAKELPPEEKYNLASQMRRAALSLTNNLAEGHGRFHFQENIQFCRQSRGSLFELIDHVHVAEECEYINREEREELIDHMISAIRLFFRQDRRKLDYRSQSDFVFT